MKRGFSLVELSIVLVILGLLTGGILAGQSLIRASELRSITSELSRFAAATNSFRDKYFALPGDMANATKFWGTDSSGCPNGGGSAGTCDGNGGGTINSSMSNQCENQEYWRQLGLAALIEGQYTPQTTASCFAAFIPGRDSARSKINNAGYTVSYVGSITSNAAFPGTALWIGNYSNMMFFGGNSNSINGMAGNGVLKPEEAWNIDTKMDDGMPATGNLLSIYPGTYAPAAGVTGCVTTNVAATAAYSLSGTTNSCAFAFKPGF